MTEMQEIEVKCYFTREKLISWLLLDKENPFDENDYANPEISDDQIIKEAFDEGYINNIDKSKIYCFDNGNIIIHKTINDFTSN